MGSEVDAGRSLSLVDVDSDGDIDLLVGNYSHTNKLYRNDGKGGFDATGTDISGIGTADSSQHVSLGDMDGDGDYDLLLSHSSRAIHALENTGDSSGPAWTRKSAWDLASAATATAPSKMSFGALDVDGVPEALIGGNYSAG